MCLGITPHFIIFDKTALGLYQKITSYSQSILVISSVTNHLLSSKGYEMIRYKVSTIKSTSFIQPVHFAYSYNENFKCIVGHCLLKYEDGKMY